MRASVCDTALSVAVVAATVTVVAVPRSAVRC